MPTYDYDCTECGHAFEEFQSITAAPLEVCPQCGGKVQRRINGGAGLIFKGSGFYLTDYKRAPAGGPKGGDGKSGNEAAKKDGDTAAKKEGSDAVSKEGSEKGTSEKPEKKEKSTTE
ncbi:MAG: FmdB family zinc ribbon protein [bacterium]